MPWWSWILLWIAVSAVSILFIAALAIKIWRDASKTMDSFSEVSDELSDYWARSELRAEESQHTEPREVIAGSAVFARPEQMKDDYLAAKLRRRFVRLQRRVARRKENGQLQSLSDITALEDVG